MLFHIIWLRKGEMYISKKEYAEWKEIQNEFDDYMTSLSFNSLEDLKAWLTEEYPLNLINIETALNELDKSAVETTVLLPI